MSFEAPLLSTSHENNGDLELGGEEDYDNDTPVSMPSDLAGQPTRWRRFWQVYNNDAPTPTPAPARSNLAGQLTRRGHFWQAAALAANDTLAFAVSISHVLVLFGGPPPKIDMIGTPAFVVWYYAHFLFLSVLQRVELVVVIVLAFRGVSMAGMYGAFYFQRCLICVPLLLFSVGAISSLVALQFGAVLLHLFFIAPQAMLVYLISKREHVHVR